MIGSSSLALVLLFLSALLCDVGHSPLDGSADRINVINQHACGRVDMLSEQSPGLLNPVERRGQASYGFHVERKRRERVLMRSK